MLTKKQYKHNWYIKNRKRILKERKIYRLKNLKMIKKTKRKYYKKNKKEIIEKTCTYQEMNKDKLNKKRKNFRLKKLYNITLKEYNYLLKTQNGRCAICNGYEKVKNRNLAVDHNHKTNKIRGLLCYRCNVLLGMAHDDINFLYKIIKYLKRTNK